jgi:competence protein ComEC
MHRWLSHFQLYCLLIIVAVASAWLVYINHFLVLVILMGLLVSVYKKRWQYGLVFCISFLSSFGQISHYQSQWITALTPLSTVQVKPISFSHKNKWGYSTTVQDIHTSHRYILNSEFAIDDYSECSLEAKLKEFTTRHNANQADFRQHFYTNKILASLKTERIECQGKGTWRVAIKKYWLGEITGKYTKAVVSALVFGDKSLFDAKNKAVLLNSQIMHLFVISGAHIVFILMLLTLLLKALAYAPITLKYVPVSIFLSGVCLVYAYLAGFEVPVFRAMIALLFWLFIRRFFNVSAWSALLGLAAFMLIVEPLYLLNVSFILSFVMVAVMVTQHSIIGPGAGYRAWGLLIIKLWLVSCLLSILFNMPINTLGVFNNIIMSWVVSFVLLPISIFSLLLIPFFSTHIERLFVWVFEWLAWISNYNVLSDSYAFYIAILLVLVMAIFTQISRLFYISLLAIWFLVSFSKLSDSSDDTKGDTLQVISFDVGQGQATLIKSPDVWVLYDMGFADEEHVSNPKMIHRYLRHQTPPNTMIWIVSHSDNDHSGGFEYLLQHSTVQPDMILMGQVGKYKGESSNIETCHGKTLDFQQTQIKVAPLNGAFELDNDHSCVVMVKHNQQSILLTGDISKKREYHLLDQGWFDSVDILQLAHHGSNTSSSDEFLQTVNPGLIINNSGLNNRFNHPSPVVMKKLKKYEYVLLDTAVCGGSEITLSSDGTEHICMKSNVYPWQKLRIQAKSNP